MPTPNLRHLAFALPFFLFALRTAEAQPRALCDRGYQPSTTTFTDGVYIECWGDFTTTVRNYVSYQPCTSPGVYLSSDEVPSGSSAGRDRCTAMGVSGPALPCAAGLSVEIVKGAKDKCYSTSTSTKKQKGDLRCFRVENNMKVACKLF